MKRTSIRRALVPGIAALALALSACGAGNERERGQRRPTGALGHLSGGGASSQESAQAAWRAGFQTANPGRHHQLRPGRLRRRVARTSSARPTRSPAPTRYLNDDEGELTAAKERCGGEDPIEVPAYVSPIAVIFNLDGVDSLNLVRRRDRQHLRRQDHQRGTTRRSPPLNDGVDLPGHDDLAGAPLRRLGHHGQLHRLPRPRPATAPGPTSRTASGRSGRRGRRGHLRRRRRGQGRRGHHRLRRRQRQAGDLGVVSVQVGEEFIAPVRRGRRQGLAVSPARRGPRRDRHGRRARPHHHRVRCLPGAAGVLPDRLPDLRRRRQRPSWSRGSCPTSSRTRASRPPPTRPAPLRSTPRCQEKAAGHRRRHRRRLSSPVRITAVRPAERSPYRRDANTRSRRVRHRPTEQEPPLSRRRPAEAAAGHRRPDLLGPRPAAGLTIMVALAGVFVFLAIEGYPGLSADRASSTAPATDFWGYVGPLVFGTTLAAVDRAGHRRAVRDRHRAVHLALRAARLASPIAYVIDLLAAVPASSTASGAAASSPTLPGSR